MDHKSMDIAMDIFAQLIMGQSVSRVNHPELYEAYSTQAQVGELLDALVRKSNLTLYEYRNALYITPGDQNKVFGYTNEELKRAIGLRLNRELYLAYMIIFDVMTLFYDNTASTAAVTYVKVSQVIDSVTPLLAAVLEKAPALNLNEVEEKSFRSLAALWDSMPLVTDNEDAATYKAARGSKTGFTKLVFNFLISQKLFLESGGKYYITERMQALIEHYYDNNKSRLYEIISQSRSSVMEEDDHAAY